MNIISNHRKSGAPYHKYGAPYQELVYVLEQEMQLRAKLPEILKNYYEESGKDQKNNSNGIIGNGQGSEDEHNS